MAQPTIDHRGPAFADLTLEIIPGLRRVFNTSGPVIMYPGSATGGWEAAFTNTLSAGDKILMFDSGVFALNWKIATVRFGLDVDFVSCDWRRGVDPDTVEENLKADASHEIKSVMVVHNETSSGITNSIAQVREAMNRAGHEAASAR